jgi:tRNA pseudouridine55 synthase
MKPIDQILNIRKPLGWTSFDMIRWIQVRMKKVKIGHAGTLDPFAQGVMVLGFGAATKRLQHAVDAEKEYIATFRFGLETDTLDLSGRTINNCDSVTLNESELAGVMQSMTGESEQIPPIYSALKIGGKRAYTLARQGKEVKLEPRRITIYEFALLDVAGQSIKVKIVCSKGTYIRSLARDLAEKLHTCSYVQTLVRTRVGTFRLEDAIELDTVPGLLGSQ